MAQGSCRSVLSELAGHTAARRIGIPFHTRTLADRRPRAAAGDLDRGEQGGQRGAVLVRGSLPARPSSTSMKKISE
jgi:hypothetical protein